MKTNNFKFEATGDFPFTFFIEKAIASGNDDEMVIEGVASTTNIDHDNERMAPEALHSMAEIINEKSVPLRVEHSKDDKAIVGEVYEARVDERNQLWIKARLDKSHAASSILYKSLKDGVKLGLSVGGRVKHAVKELSEAAGKMVKTFYQVMLDEVSVTQHPANYDAYLIRKSIVRDKDNAELVSAFQKDFIFETRADDYLYSFAKSVPSDSWEKVNLNEYNNNVMKTKKEETTMEEENKETLHDTGETSSVTNKSFEEFKDFVTKGFDSLTSILAKLTKTEEETSETKEKAETSHDETETEETKTKGEKEMETETETKTKAEKETETETETETKKTETETSETKEKDAKDTEEDETAKNGYGSQYRMKNLLSRMGKLSKAMDKTTDETETKEKGEKEEETEETTKSASIDQFVEALEKSVSNLEKKFAATGMRVPGLTQHFAELVKSDPEVQKSIKEMLKEPGAKKSVSIGGTAFMKSKEGRMYALTDIAEESVNKSRDMAGKSFKELYKSTYSSVAEAQANE